MSVLDKVSVEALNEELAELDKQSAEIKDKRQKLLALKRVIGKGGSTGRRPGRPKTVNTHGVKTTERRRPGRPKKVEVKVVESPKRPKRRPGRPRKVVVAE